MRVFSRHAGKNMGKVPANVPWRGVHGRVDMPCKAMLYVRLGRYGIFHHSLCIVVYIEGGVWARHNHRWVEEVLAHMAAQSLLSLAGYGPFIVR